MIGYGGKSIRLGRHLALLIGEKADFEKKTV